MMNSSTHNSKLTKFSLLAVLLTALSLFLPTLASAEDPYPNKSLRWIVSFPAGGAADFLARTMAAQMGKQMSQSIIVENRPSDSSCESPSAISKRERLVSDG